MSVFENGDSSGALDEYCVFYEEMIRLKRGSLRTGNSWRSINTDESIRATIWQRDARVPSSLNHGSLKFVQTHFEDPSETRETRPGAKSALLRRKRWQTVPPSRTLHPKGLHWVQWPDATIRTRNSTIGSEEKSLSGFYPNFRVANKS